MNQGFCTAYTPGPESPKLSELRAKTDRQILRLLHSKLELGFNLVALAEGEKSAGELALEQADQSLAEVRLLLPALNDEQRAFDPKFTELREALDRLCRHGSSGMSYAVSAF